MLYVNDNLIFMNKKYLKGFTLVELMVTISVIGILTAVISANFNDARQQANDKKRMTDLKSLQLSLELYKSQYGSYPKSTTVCSGGSDTDFFGPGTAGGGFKSCANYIPGLVPEFTSVLPTDSKSTAGKGFYYRSDGTSYKAMVYGTVESLIVNSYADEFARCPKTNVTTCPGASPIGDNSKTYAVYSKGAENW